MDERCMVDWHSTPLSFYVKNRLRIEAINNPPKDIRFL